MVQHGDMQQIPQDDGEEWEAEIEAPGDEAQGAADCATYQPRMTYFSNEDTQTSSMPFVFQKLHDFAFI